MINSVQMQESLYNNFNIVKSPLNYIGGKYKILSQMLPFFPANITNFVDLFTGGCNVGINAHAKTIYCNDNLTYLIDMYKTLQTLSMSKILLHIDDKIKQFNLSLENQDGYLQMRNHYNIHKYPLDLFVLIAYSFNHQIRFNNSHHFNNPFGKNRSSFNQSMRENLINFIYTLHSKNIVFTSNCFTKFDFSFLNSSDFVYCDPPYLITTGTYNDGKRGFDGWNEKEECALLEILTNLNKKGIKFALSNVLKHKGKTNDILQDWINSNDGYNVHYINKNYSNSNYQTLDRNPNASVEVLITNYKTY